MQAETNLPAVLQAIQRELSDLAERARHLQDCLSPLVQQGHGEELQGLDLLTQQLFGLADFLDTLLPALPDQMMDLAPALGVMTLSDQVLRLTGMPAAPMVAPGGLELFDDD